MPGTGLQPHSVLKRQRPYARHASDLHGDEARIERLLQQVHLQCLSGTREPQGQASITAGRFHQFHVVSRRLEGTPDMPGDLRERGVIPRGKVQILGWTMQDLMSPEGISSGQQQAVALEDGQASSSTRK